MSADAHGIKYAFKRRPGIRDYKDLIIMHTPLYGTLLSYNTDRISPINLPIVYHLQRIPLNMLSIIMIGLYFYCLPIGKSFDVFDMHIPKHFFFFLFERDSL